MTPINISPLLTTGLMAGFGLSVDQAGLVLTIELLALAITAAVLSRLAERVQVKQVLLGGAGLVVLGNFVAPMFESLQLFSVCRLVAGIGAGLLLFGVNVGISRMPNPVRMYGLANTAGLAVAAILFVFLPHVLALWGLRGVYLALLGLAFAVFLLGLFYREQPRRIVLTNSAASHGVLLVSVQTRMKLLLGMLTIVSTYIAFYAFTEHMGGAVGWSNSEMGVWLAWVQVAAILATLTAAWLGVRFGLFRPLALALVGQAVIGFVATWTSDRNLFIVSIVLVNVLFLFSVPYLLGVAATLDTTGRLATLGAGVFYIGGALGPYLGGFLIATQGFVSIGLAMCIGAAIGLVMYRNVLAGQSTQEVEPA